MVFFSKLADIYGGGFSTFAFGIVIASNLLVYDSTEFMKSMQQNNDGADPVYVIVQAYDSEPVTQILYSIDKHKVRAIVGGLDGRASISLPMDRVFPYDEEMLARMSSAYVAGDRDGLEKLYGEARKDLQ